MAKKLPRDMPYIKTVKAKGRVYEYFDTGRDVFGKRVLRPLPKRSDVRNFGSVYSALLAARTARERASAVPTIRDLSRLYQLTDRFRKRAENTQNTYLVYLRMIEEKMGDAPVNQVERRDVQEMIDQMEDRPGAAAMTLLVLRNLYTLAMRKEWVGVNPTKDVALPEPDEDADHQPWPEDLLAAALEDPAVNLPVALLYFTGQRIGDVCRMRWDDIEDESIRVTQQKTGKRAWVPIHTQLAAILAGAPRDAATILFGRKGRSVRVPTLRGQLQKWAKARDHEIVPHGLRKNAVIALLEVGCTTVEASAITMQSLGIVEHYARHRNTRRLGRKAMSKWDGTERGNRKPVENS